MSLQTGGRAMGAISTRSRSASWARRSASAVGTMPTVSPLGPTRRTSETRIRSLIRSSVLMCPPVVGGRVVSSCGRGPEINEGFRSSKRKPVATRHREVIAPPRSTTERPASGGTYGTGPDDLIVLRSMRVGDDVACPPLDDRFPGRLAARGTDRSTPEVSRTFRHAANRWGAPRRAARQPGRASSRQRDRAGPRPRRRQGSDRRHRPPGQPPPPGPPTGPRAA